MIRRNYYIYQKSEANIIINKMPIYFKEVEFTGDKTKGTIRFDSQNNYDEIWGPNAKLEIEWSPKERTRFFHAKEVQESIDAYNAIKVVVTRKETSWLNTHEFTYWSGGRNKIVRKRYYPENHIHGTFYCEFTERQFELHTVVIREHYEGYKPFILEAYNSLICHE